MAGAAASLLPLLAVVVAALHHVPAARASIPSAAALLAEGDAAFSRGEFSSSIRHYSDAIDADPTQALFFTKRAAAYMSLRQHSAALRDLNHAIAADAGFTQGYLHRGKLHRQLCNVAAARSDLEAVARIKPGHKAALKELDALQHLEAAVGMLDQVDTLAPAAAKQAIALVLEAAPDCTKAQVAEARMDFGAKNYEQVCAFARGVVWPVATRAGVGVGGTWCAKSAAEQLVDCSQRIEPHRHHPNHLTTTTTHQPPPQPLTNHPQRSSPPPAAS